MVFKYISQELHALSADGHLLFGTRIVRMFAYGFLAVVLMLYLVQVGLSETQIGLLLTLTLLGDTFISLWITTTADRMGRGRMLMIGAVLMVFAGILFALTRNFMLLLIAAAGFVLWPSRGQWLPTSVTAAPTSPPPVAKVAPPVTTDASAREVSNAGAQPTAAVAEPAGSSGPAVVTETVHSAPPAAAADAAQALPAGLAVVRATEPSWVEVSDARGAVLLSRTLQPGESVGLDGAVPLRLVIGNGPATEVLLRGKRVALAPAGRDNVVRMELR